MSRLVDRALQRGALIGGRARPHAELRGVEAEIGQRGGFYRRGKRRGERAKEDGAAVGAHARHYAPLARAVC
jgi:hypothetical protein